MSKDIQFKEMKAVLHAIKLWLDKLQGTHLTLYCDNFPCVSGIRKLSIKGPAMAPLRNIAMLLAKYDIMVSPIWIPTKENELADDLSRFKYQKIADKYPQLRHLVTPPLS